MNGPAIARVVLDSPLPQLDRLFDYRIPEGMADVAPGVRVRVPLRSAGRLVDGFVIETDELRPSPTPLSDIESVVSPVPVLRPEVWALARAVATRAAGGANDVLRLAIPPRQVRVEKAWLARGEAAEPEPVAPARIDRYGSRLEELIATGGRAAVTAIPGVVEVQGGQSAGSQWVGHWALTMAQAAARTVAAGKSAILIVPDYRDQEQLAAALGAVLPESRIAAVDARQSNADRYRTLLRASDDVPLAIVGTRSAVYAPSAALGLIAIWDDGDPLLTEQHAPYVHPRDAALVRQEQQGAALLLLGHSRSAETERLAEMGYLRYIAPTTPGRPRVLLSENVIGREGLAQHARIPSMAWNALREGLDRGPVLVQVARPGFAPGLACAGCAEPARCARCRGPLRQAQARGPASCSLCGALAAGWRCPACAATEMRPRGVGATRTAEDLGRAFPGALVILADGERTVTRVEAGRTLVIATRGAEPVAAGGYRAVALLDGERMLARESLRVTEDCLRWWSNAAALAAPGAPVVLVGVGSAIGTAMASWRQSELVRSELTDRRALRFPPAVRTATLEGEPEAIERVLAELEPIGGLDVLGPTVHDGRERAVIRFDYAAGTTVADTVRAEVIRQAGRRRKPAPGTPRRGRQPVALRAHFDDATPFAE